MTATIQPVPAIDDVKRQAFLQAVADLQVGAGGAAISEQRLMVAGGVLAPMGLLVVLLGWFGASRTPHVFEQVPYLISGGLLGLGLAFVGGFLYFAHWVAELIKETRLHSVAVVTALEQIQIEMRQISFVAPTSGTSADDVTPTQAIGMLYATQRGAMAHRVDCAAVANKGDLREVGIDDGLKACKLCDPYEVA